MSEARIPQSGENKGGCKPVLLLGEILLGRTTGRIIEPEDFRDSNVLMNLSNSNLTKSVNRKTVTVRRKTEPEDVIRAVLRVSHADEFGKKDSKLEEVVQGLLDSYQDAGIDLRDRFIIDAIEERSEKDSRTDLMRGMAAFAVAEYEQYQGTYELTIIRPATLLAGWMIAKESSPDLA